VDLRTWQEIKAGVRPGDVVPDRVYQEFTAVAVEATNPNQINLGEGDEAAGTTSLTKEVSFDASPGFSAETSTLELIRVFLYAISALVVGAFFTVLTIQRKPEIAVLRAMGASTRYILQDSLMQSVILLTASSVVGLAIGLSLGSLVARTPMPFALDLGAVFGATALLIVLGLVGAAVAVVRITRIAPITALGESR